MMSLWWLLICAGACSIAVLGALWVSSLWSVMADRMIRTVHLQLQRDGVIPGNTTVKAGFITLTLVNEHKEAFHLYIKGDETEITSPKIRPGQRRDWAVQLDPGKYNLSLLAGDLELERSSSLLTVVSALGTGGRS